MVDILRVSVCKIFQDIYSAIAQIRHVMLHSSWLCNNIWPLVGWAFSVLKFSFKFDPFVKWTFRESTKNCLIIILKGIWMCPLHFKLFQKNGFIIYFFLLFWKLNVSYWNNMARFCLQCTTVLPINDKSASVIKYRGQHFIHRLYHCWQCYRIMYKLFNIQSCIKSAILSL